MTVNHGAQRGQPRPYRLLGQAEQLLSDGFEAATPDERFRCAHLAALRTGAALLAARAGGQQPPRRRGPLAVWPLLSAMDGELAHWGEFFAAGARFKARIDLGVVGVVNAEQALRWLQAAEEFFGFARDRMAAEASAPWTGREAS